MKSYYEDNTRLSNSAIGWFLQSPRYMRKMLDGEIEQEKKRYFEVGQKIHMFLLEHEEFWKNYICLDFELPKSEQEKQFCTDFINSKQKTKELKAFEAYKKSYSVSGARDEAIAYKGIEKHKKLTPYIKYLEYTQVYKDIIRPGELEWFKELELEIKQHKKARDLIFPKQDMLSDDIEVYTEMHINWEYPKEYHGINIPCKSLIDRFIVDKTNKKLILVDLKTTSNLHGFAEDSFIKLDYGRQLAWYWLAIESWLENNQTFKDYDRETYIVGLSKDRQLVESTVWWIPGMVIQEKQAIIDEYVEQITWHWVNNKWSFKRSYYETDGYEVITLGE